MSYQPPEPPQYWQQPQQPYQAPPPYPGAPAMGYGYPPQQRPKRRKLPFVLGGVGAVLMLCLGGTALAIATDDGARESFEAGVNSVGDGTNEAAKPAVQKTASSPEPTVKPKPTAKPKPVGGTFQKLSARDWLLIVKDPDGHRGDRVVVYGVVNQFDAATGLDLFMADAGPTRDESPSDVNTTFVGDADLLSGLVQGDEFRAEAEVAGSDTYDTQEGGNTSTPKLRVVSITKL